jgi:hypothetical protein
MTNHLLLLLVFVLCVSTVMAVIQKDTRAEQVRLARMISAAFAGVALVLRWLLFPFPW